MIPPREVKGRSLLITLSRATRATTELRTVAFGGYLFHQHGMAALVKIGVAPVNRSLRIKTRSPQLNDKVE